MFERVYSFAALRAGRGEQRVLVLGLERGYTLALPPHFFTELAEGKNCVYIQYSRMQGKKREAC